MRRWTYECEEIHAGSSLPPVTNPVISTLSCVKRAVTKSGFADLHSKYLHKKKASVFLFPVKADVNFN